MVNLHQSMTCTIQSQCTSMFKRRSNWSIKSNTNMLCTTTRKHWTWLNNSTISEKISTLCISVFQPRYGIVMEPLYKNTWSLILMKKVNLKSSCFQQKILKNQEMKKSKPKMKKWLNPMTTKLQKLKMINPKKKLKTKNHTTANWNCRRLLKRSFIAMQFQTSASKTLSTPSQTGRKKIGRLRKDLKIVNFL